MTERDQASFGIVSAHQPWTWFGKDSHRTALSHLRLLLDVEPHPLHLRQYDFRGKQPVAHRFRRRELVDADRVVDGERAIGLAHQPPEIPADPEPLTEIARDRAKVGAAAATNVDARDRARSGHEVNQSRRVDLHLA